MALTPNDKAAAALREAKSLVVVTGAGVSAESGIPTFRGPGGLWEGFRAEQLATPLAFAADPGLVWRWYRWRRGICLDAEPNPGHRVIAEMEEAFPEFLLATQNVDGLHPRAGSRTLVELHGNIHTGRCTGCSRIAPLSDPPCAEDDAPPECLDCGAMLRPHIVWFGESYWPGVLEQAMAAAARAEVVIVAGTSAQVWVPAEIALSAARNGAFLIDVNPEETQISASAHVHLAGPSGEVLPALWNSVRDA